jgi:hypothetical protein
VPRPFAVGAFVFAAQSDGACQSTVSSSASCAGIVVGFAISGEVSRTDLLTLPASVRVLLLAPNWYLFPFNDEPLPDGDVSLFGVHNTQYYMRDSLSVRSVAYCLDISRIADGALL